MLNLFSPKGSPRASLYLLCQRDINVEESKLDVTKDDILDVISCEVAEANLCFHLLNHLIRVVV